MKHLSRGLLMALTIGVLIVNAAVAGPLVATVTGKAGNNFCTDSLIYGAYDSSAAVFKFSGGPLSPDPGEAGYMISIYYRDTVAAAAAADSVIFRIVRRPQGAEDLKAYRSAQITDNPYGWITVYSFALTQCNSTNFPLSKHIPFDSLAVYPLGLAGELGVIAVGGNSEAGHYWTKAQKWDVIIEDKGHH